MDQDIERDPAPLCPGNRENNQVNSETYMKKRGGLDLGLSPQANNGEGTQAFNNPEGEADTIKTGRSKEKKPLMCLRSFNLETRISTRPRTMSSIMKLQIKVLWIVDVL